MSEGRKRISAWVLAAFICTSVVRPAAAASPLVVGSGFKTEAASRRLEVAHDETGAVTLDGAIAGRTIHFEPTSREVPNEGYRPGVEWARLPIECESDRKVVAHVAYAVLDEVLFALEQNGRVLWSERVGDHVPTAARERSLGYREPAVAFQCPGGRSTLYLRIASSTSKQFPVSIYADDAWLEHERFDLIAQVAYFAALGVMLLYNALVAAWSRSSTYGWYASFLALYGLTHGLLTGFLNVLVFRGAAGTAPELMLVAVLAGLSFSALAFGQSLLGRPIYKPLDRIFVVLRWISLVPLVLCVAGNLPAASRLAVVLAIAGSAALIGLGFDKLRSRNTLARLFLLAWGVLLSTSLLYLLKTVGLAPVNPITTFAPQIGSVFEFVILSLALAERMNQLQARAAEQARIAQAASELALQEQVKANENLRRFVPEDFLGLLGVARFDALSAGIGQRHEVTILFADVRGFTTRSEQLGPEGIFQFINACLARFEPVVRRHGGFVDKFIGDAVMAIFPGDANAGALAAADIQAEVISFNAARPNAQAPLAVGVGVHRGAVILGTIGVAERMEVTAIGDAVNVAARLESLTKALGVAALASEDAAAGGSVGARRVGAVRVKGRATPVELFELLECVPSQDERRQKEATADRFQRGLRSFVQGDVTRAREHFAACVEDAPLDRVAELYLQRCERYCSEGLPTAFDGCLDGV